MFYTTRQWRKCRKAYLQSQSGLCELCLKRGLIVPAMEVHHIKPITPQNISDPAITLNFDNLMALCEPCHDEQHHKQRWRSDELGHVDL